jgi:hypothetical protein
MGGIMKKLFLLFAIISLCAVFLVVGCSDNATENNLTEGDYNDPGYQTARYLTDQLVDSLSIYADVASDFITFDGSQPMSPAAESLLITFDQETCWWHIYISSDTTDASLLFVDSLKFQDSEGCQQFPDSLTTNSIEYRAYFDISMIGDSTTVSATANENLLLEGIQGDICSLTATATSYAEVASGLYEAAYDYSGAMDNIRFLTEELMYSENPKPISGTMLLNLSIYGSGQQGSANWNGTVIITFNETGYHARAESGENYWEWDVTYVA